MRSNNTNSKENSEGLDPRLRQYNRLRSHDGILHCPPTLSLIEAVRIQMMSLQRQDSEEGSVSGHSTPSSVLLPEDIERHLGELDDSLFFSNRRNHPRHNNSGQHDADRNKPKE